MNPIDIYMRDELAALTESALAADAEMESSRRKSDDARAQIARLRLSLGLCPRCGGEVFGVRPVYVWDWYLRVQPVLRLTALKDYYHEMIQITDDYSSRRYCTWGGEGDYVFCGDGKQ